ncbi:MAG TPA: hypothetical protein PKV16_09020 [Caldisericia bacterium]|mgnify:CR=1 FL=1|nr:hypothetical protein [Caldisericia bacterium]HPQ93903.1 hypothetical protein [Caldisericia bacterium]HRV75705.1 hypothetical protein [Caldisericia bacterium]
MKRYRIRVEIDGNEQEHEIQTDVLYNSLVDIAKSMDSEIEGLSIHDKKVFFPVSGKEGAGFPYGKRLLTTFGWVRIFSGGYSKEEKHGYITVNLLQQ